MRPLPARAQPGTGAGGLPWHAHLVLLRPRRALALLNRVRSMGVIEPVPTLWQLQLAVLRMWHRIVFRSETIGTCHSHAVRSTWRARLLRFRPLRFPFLCWERAITPWDLIGWLSSRAQFVRHLLCAHHDGTQCVYDLQILSLEEGALDELRQAVVRIVQNDDRRSRWVRDLCVFEGYHEGLLAAIDAVRGGALELNGRDGASPDISFWATMRWCARQPVTPTAWWAALRAGRFDWEHGLVEGSF